MVRFLFIVALTFGAGCSLLLDWSGEGAVCGPQAPCFSGFSCTDGTCRKVSVGDLKPGFNVLAPLSTARNFHSANFVKGGKVLVAGGMGTGNTPLSSTEIYDVNARTWASGDALANPRAQHAGVLLSDERVLLVGGKASSNESQLLTGTEVYEPDTAQFFNGPALGVGRIFHGATMLALSPTKDVIVAGGWPLSSVLTEVYPQQASQWAQKANLNVPRYGHRLVRVGKSVIALGGRNDSTVLGSAEVYNASNSQWTTVPTNMATPRFDFTATEMAGGDERILLVGGVSTIGGGASGALSTAEIFSLKTNQWSNAGTMSVSRARHAAVLLDDGKILVAGGQNSTGFLDSAELFDPATNSFTAAGTLSEARQNLTATKLSDGTVLLVGGEGANGASAAVDLYVP